MEKLQIKHSIALTAVSVIVSSITFIKITKHSNITLAEILIILALGMGIGALFFNLAYLYKLNRDGKSQISVHQPEPPFNKNIILINSSCRQALPKIENI